MCLIRLKVLLGIFAFLCNINTSSAATTGRNILCEFTSSSDADGNKTDSFILEFYFDSKNKAYMKGNVGVAEVTPSAQLGGVSFIEKTPAGNIMLTTIDNNGNAVHSRHTVIFGELVPSQSYGKCTTQDR